MPDSFYAATYPNNTGDPHGPSLIAILDQAKSYAHPIRMLENKIRITRGEIKEAENELAACQKKMDGQNRYLRALSSFWMAVATVIAGIVLSVAVMVAVFYAILGFLAAVAEFILILIVLLVLISWNNSNIGLYIMIGIGVVVAILLLIYFVILAASLLAVFAIRNFLTIQAQRRIRESERLFPEMSSRIEQLNKELNKLEYERSEWEKHLSALRKKYSEVFRAIPLYMIREEGLSFLSSALKEGRVSGLAEAVALYEKQVRSYNLENEMAGSSSQTTGKWDAQDRTIVI